MSYSLSDLKHQFKNGLIEKNPVLVQMLGMCSALAITTSVINAIGMGFSVTAVLICSNLLISLLRKFIPEQIRIASYIVIIAGFVTAVQMVMHAYTPDLYRTLRLHSAYNRKLHYTRTSRSLCFKAIGSAERGRRTCYGTWLYSRHNSAFRHS